MNWRNITTGFREGFSSLVNDLGVEVMLGRDGDSWQIYIGKQVEWLPGDMPEELARAATMWRFRAVMQRQCSQLEQEAGPVLDRHNERPIYSTGKQSDGCNRNDPPAASGGAEQ